MRQVLRDKNNLVEYVKIVGHKECKHKDDIFTLAIFIDRSSLLKSNILENVPDREFLTIMSATHNLIKRTCFKTSSSSFFRELHNNRIKRMLQSLRPEFAFMGIEGIKYTRNNPYKMEVFVFEADHRLSASIYHHPRQLRHQQSRCSRWRLRR